MSEAFPLIDHIKHFFSRLFGGSSHTVETILNEIHNDVLRAKPVVAELAAIAQQITNPSALMLDLRDWLSRYGHAADAIADWIAANAGSSVPDILRSAAALIVRDLMPTGTAASVINLIIEFAYQIFKRESKI